MPDRHALAETFLSGTDWATAHRAPLAEDASNRRYERLTEPGTGQTAVLMDAPPERGEDVRPFLRIARHLQSIGLSAPGILAEDPFHGFLLIEDLGDALFARIIPECPDLESVLYEAATDVLLQLHRAPMPDLDPYDAARMTDMAALAFSEFRQGIVGDNSGEDLFRDKFLGILSRIAAAEPVLVQRDYHAENLLWLPNRQGVARVGLLDFQDAMAGHPAYDLVSLLQDARRDVPDAIQSAMKDRYIERSGVDRAAFETAYTCLGVQRSLRILGVFARLGKDFGKPHYVDLIPRVWRHFQSGLQHPALAPVARVLNDALPQPTAENLQKLRLP